MSVSLNEKVEVVLVKPQFADIAVIPPIGLTYLGAILEENGIKVKIIDNTLLKLPTSSLVTTIKDSGARIVGLSSTTPMIDSALEICKAIRGMIKEIHICIGGPHPTSAYREVLQTGLVDSVVIGEGEKSFSLIVERILGNRELEGIEGIAYVGPSNEIIKTPINRDHIDLDTLPLPAFHLLSVEKYFQANQPYGVTQNQRRNLPIMATRGCPSRCTFCQRFMGASFRVMSPEKFVESVLYLSDKYHVNDFNFLDDNFTFDKDYALKVCTMLSSTGRQFTLRFPNGVRDDFLDDELLEAIKACGGYHLDFGIESGVQSILDIMKKGKTTERIWEKVRLAKKHKFTVTGSFIFGTPGETLEEMRESIRFAKKISLDRASFVILVPFPGTVIRSKVVREGNLIHRSYSKYTGRVPLIRSPDWTGEDLVQMLKLAYRSFYLRPRIVTKSMVSSLRNPLKSIMYVSRNIANLYK